MLYDLQNNSDKLLDVVINDTDSSDGMSPSDQVKSLKGDWLRRKDKLHTAISEMRRSRKDSRSVSDLSSVDGCSEAGDLKSIRNAVEKREGAGDEPFGHVTPEGWFFNSVFFFSS